MPRILVSYRRQDSAAYAGRIADRLREHFGRDDVFIDIDTISPGEDFLDAIDKSLEGADVLVAVIGPGWMTSADGAGRRRLDRQDDFVRQEIAKALERHVRVIPALVGDAAMPEANDLPQDLRALTRRQAIEISDSRFHQDVDRLIHVLSETGPLQREHAAPPRPVTHDRSGPRIPVWTWIVVALVAVAGAVGFWKLRGDSTESDARKISSASGAPAGGSTPIPASRPGDPVGEREPNNDILHPTVLTFGTTVRAAIHPESDQDFYRIHTPPGGRSEIRVVVSNRSKLEPEVMIWDSKFATVTSKYETSGDLYLTFEGAPSSDYFVEVRYLLVLRYRANPQDSGSYELTVLAAAK